MIEELIHQAKRHEEEFEWDDAERAYRTALEEAEAPGQSESTLADCLHRLGVYYDQNFRGSRAEAEKLLRRALSIRESIYGPLHRQVGATSLALGMLCRHDGRLDEGEEFYRSALRIFESTGDDLFAEALQELADLYESNGEGRAVILEYIERRELSGGPDDRLLGHALRALVWYQTQAKEATEAEKTLERALTIFEKHGDEVMVATSLFDLGDLLFQTMGEFERAALVLERALALAESMPEASIQLKVGLTSWLARLYSTAYFERKWNESESYYRRAVDICESFPSKRRKSIDLKFAVANLAQFLERAGKLEQANEWQRISMQREYSNPNPVQDFYNIPARLRLLLKQRQFTEAEKLVNDCLDFFQVPDQPIFEYGQDELSDAVMPPPLTLRDAIEGAIDNQERQAKLDRGCSVEQFRLKLLIDLCEIERVRNNADRVQALVTEVLKGKPKFEDAWDVDGLQYSRLVNFVHQLSYLGWEDQFDRFVSHALDVASGEEPLCAIRNRDVPAKLLELADIIAEGGNVRRAQSIVEKALVMCHEHRPPGTLLYAYLLEECAFILRNGSLCQVAETLQLQAESIRKQHGHATNE